MTNREFYTAIVNSNVSDELKAFATDAIAKLDARNAKRSSKPSKKSLENAPIKNSIAEFQSSSQMVLTSQAKSQRVLTSRFPRFPHSAVRW